MHHPNAWPLWSSRAMAEAKSGVLIDEKGHFLYKEHNER